MSFDLFPFAEYWWFYLAFTGFILLLVSLDLGVFHKTAHVVSFKEAAGWSAVWVILSLCFNYFLYRYSLHAFQHNPRLISLPDFNPQHEAHQVALEFLTGYLVEKSLSVDNIFVFVVVFNYFAIPAKYQHRVLFFGILGALIFRAIFIALGAVLMQFEYVVIFFGAVLMITGVKMMFIPDKEIRPDRNPVIRGLKRIFRVTQLEGQKFFVRSERTIAITPLFIALVFLEMTDILFAIDSVPAIFAITDEPLIVFTSNVFAILGLRALYFMLAGAIERFHMLKYGLALVLIFVGLKMVWLNHAFGGKFPITISLAVISSVILASVVLSLLFPKKVVE